MSTDLNSYMVTGDGRLSMPGHIVTPVQQPVREKIDLWYFEPLRRMSGHEAFICLVACFALYEKYLRLTGAMPGKQEFTKGHKVFQLIGEQIHSDPDTAFLIWNSWRNGLLHRAMPNERQDVQWALDGKQNVPVKKDGATITINPWMLRDRILKVVEANREIWKDAAAPLMSVYEVSPLK